LEGLGRAVGAFLVVFGALSVAVAARSEPYRLLSIEKALVQWQPPTDGAHIVLHYALAKRPVATSGATNCGRMRPVSNLLQTSGMGHEVFRRAAAEAFLRWQNVVDITFVEVSDDTSADIVIGEQADPEGFAYTNVVIDRSRNVTNSPITGAQICLNPQKRWKIGFNGDLTVYDLVHTISHEIGHAIGLDHPDEGGHLMSFRYHETRANLSDGDVLGAIQIYGRRPASPSGRHGVGIE
jgi:predicted Zn-dependent protease